jgi:hypothetical protein
MTYEKLAERAHTCEYAHLAVGTDENPINWGDAEGFFIDGWNEAKKACAKAIKEKLGDEWIECHYQLLMNTIMDAEVKE